MAQTETLLETTKFPGIAGIYSWSSNYDIGSNPFSGFLDIIGYSDEQYGQKVNDRDFSWGYLELGQLADALAEYASNPQDAADFVNALLASEGN